MYKTIFTQILSITFLTSISINSVYSQKGKKVTTVNTNNSVQINSKLDSLYADYDIEIKIPAPYNIYGITVSQGSIRNNDDSAKNISGLNILSGLKTGAVIITIYKNNQVSKQRTFGVREKVFPQYARRTNKSMSLQPIITFAGKDTGGIIKKSALYKVTKLEINKPYKILKFTLIVQPDYLEIISLKSMYFDKKSKDCFNKLWPNSNIIIDEIYFEDSEGNIYKYHNALIYKAID